MLALLLAGCRTPPPPPPTDGWPEAVLERTTAVPPINLHLVAPTALRLPSATLPAGTALGEPRPVAVERRGGRPAGDGPAGKGATRRYWAPMPFDIALANDLDEGPMQVMVDGRPIPQGGRALPRWESDRYSLAVILPAGDAEPVVEAAWPGLERRLRRRDPSLSGLPPEDFVLTSLTLHDVTRDGLLLPAPASAAWTVRVPERGARLDTWLALDPSRVEGVRSDGADARLVVVDGAAEVLVARTSLRRAGEGFVPWQVDLSRWAGQEVTLRLETGVRGDPWADYVFFGSPVVSGSPGGPVRRVVVIGLDTTRADHLGFMGYDLDTSPELDTFARSGVVFERAWTPAPRTRPSFRSATTGRNPLDAVGATPIGSVFRDHGFATGALVANVHLRPRFGFDQGFDLWHYDGDADAARQVDLALDWLDRQENRDSYLFLHFMDPHTAYIPPPSFRKRFVTQERDLPARMHRWHVMDLEKQGRLEDADRNYLRELYDGEIAYLSSELGRLFEHLDGLGDQTVVVVHNDHGEEFWDHGAFEHNHTLYEEVTHGVLVFRASPGLREGVRTRVPATLADIAPTLYDLAGFTDVPPTDGQSLRPWLEDPGADPGWTRPIGLGHIRYGFERWGVVYDDQKYVLFTGSGEEELYDLRADPGESRDLLKGPSSDPSSLSRWRELLSEAHHMPVGPGWRLRVTAPRGSAPVQLELPAVPVQVEIIDPERTIANPANEPWGEPPRRRVEEIGAVQREGTRLTWTPGTNPRQGVIAVLFDEPQDPASLVIVEPGAAKIEVTSGTVVIPPPEEAERMAALGQVSARSSADHDMLESLGYVEPDDH